MMRMKHIILHMKEEKMHKDIEQLQEHIIHQNMIHQYQVNI